MKKMHVFMALLLFVFQSFALPYSYAATPAETVVDASKLQSMKEQVQKYLTAAVDGDPFDVLQMGGYLYVYTNYGDAYLDFYMGSQSAGLKKMDEFISKYAPSVGFTATQAPAQPVMVAMTKDRSMKFTKEYSALIPYIKDVQTKYKGKNILETPASAPTTNPTTPAQQNQSTCAMLIAKYMAEYDALIKVNAEYTKIYAIKEKIKGVQESNDCNPIARADGATMKDAAKQTNQAAVEQVKSALNFEAQNIAVIPNNINYCVGGSTNTVLSEQFDGISPEALAAIKETISTLMTDPSVTSSSVQANALDVAQQAVVNADASLAVTDGNSKTAFLNFVQGLFGLGNSIVNGPGAGQLINIIEANMPNISTIGEFFGEKFDGLRSIRSQAGTTYSWSNINNGFDSATNADGTLSFLIPSKEGSSDNNVKLTIAAAQSKIFQVSQMDKGAKPSTLTLQQFITEAQKNGRIWGSQIDPAGLPAAVVQTLINNNGNGYNGNSNFLTVVIAEANNGEQRLFNSYTLSESAVMGQGTYRSPWNQTYVVGEKGKLIDIFSTEEFPQHIKGSIKVDDKFVAGLDLNMVYNDAAISQGKSTSGVPLSVNAKLFLNPYLITANISRTLNGDTWDVVGSLNIEGPGVCGTRIDVTAQYLDDGKDGQPRMDGPDDTNVENMSLTITHNSHKISLSVPNIIELVNAIGDGDSDTEDMSLLFDIINQYVVADYLFDGTKLASIVPDADTTVAVKYNDDSKEGLLGILSANMSLLRLDRIAKYLGPLFESNDKEQSNGSDGDNGGYGYGYDAGQQEDYRSFWLDSYVNNNGQLSVVYSYQNQDGSMTNHVYPNKVDLVIYTAGEGCTTTYCDENSYSLTTVDNYVYSESYAYLLDNPDIVAAYIYASYDDGQSTFDDTYYIIGDEGSIKDDLPAPTSSTYSLGAQSSYYETTNTEHWVFGLYDADMFVEYVQPQFTIYTTEGTNCGIPANTCVQDKTQLLATDIDGVPTYILDYNAINDPMIYKATFTAYYLDTNGESYSQSMDIKLPQ